MVSAIFIIAVPLGAAFLLGLLAEQRRAVAYGVVGVGREPAADAAPARSAAGRRSHRLLARISHQIDTIW